MSDAGRVSIQRTPSSSSSAASLPVKLMQRQPRGSSSYASTAPATTTDSSLSLLTSVQRGAHPVNQQGPTEYQQRSCSTRCFVDALVRKKPLDGRTKTSLKRCLNLLDLTTLGVGSTLGLGLYVLTGQVASNKAGPAVVLSFALAALASAFSALCYAEFAGRVPKAGSAYAYSYVTVGEFVAFVIGWNLILEYVIGASSVARGFSGYLRFLYQQVVHGDAAEIAPPTTTSAQPAAVATSTAATIVGATGDAAAALVTVAPSLLSDAVNGTSSWWQPIGDYVCKYFDWLSIVIVLILTVFILFGVKESTNLTLVFTAVNLSVVMVVVISSLSSLDTHNWQLKKHELPGEWAGDGGFLPFGWSGVLAGSATCFFGFIGFDTIASSAEEAKDPKRNVPLSIILSLFISFLAYMAIAVIQTLLWPYYAQDNITILPYIFSQLNMPVTYWVVLLGAVAGLASSQIGVIYPLPRILYSMAQDKLIYSSLANVNRHLKLPVRATIVGSVFITLLACLLDIQDLADMVSLGTLAAYSLVSLSVLIIRYEDRGDALDDNSAVAAVAAAQLGGRAANVRSALEAEARADAATKKQSLQITILCQQNNNAKLGANNAKQQVASDANGAGKTVAEKQCAIPNIERQNTKPTDASSHKSKVYIAIVVAITILLNFLVTALTKSTDNERRSSAGAMDRMGDMSSRLDLRSLLAFGPVALTLVLAYVLFLLSKLPTSIDEKQAKMFLVPLVPITPTLSIFVNTFLMLNLSYLTWIRFAVWMAAGLFIYFSYGIWNSQGYLLQMDDEVNDGGVNLDERQIENSLGKMPMPERPLAAA